MQELLVGMEWRSEAQSLREHSTVLHTETDPDASVAASDSLNLRPTLPKCKGGERHSNGTDCTINCC